MKDTETSAHDLLGRDCDKYPDTGWLPEPASMEEHWQAVIEEDNVDLDTTITCASPPFPFVDNVSYMMSIFPLRLPLTMITSMSQLQIQIADHHKWLDESAPPHK